MKQQPHKAHHYYPDADSTCCVTQNWSKIISDYRNSGLQQKAFCKLHQLTFNQFIYQLYKEAKQRLMLTNKLVPIVFDDQPVLEKEKLRTEFFVQWPSGKKLIIPLHTDQQTLKIVIAALGEA